MLRFARPVVRVVATTALAALVAVGLTSCSAERSDQVAILAGVRGNSAAVPESLVRDAISAIDANGDRIAVVSTEGVPRVTLDLTLDDVPPNDLDREEYLDEVATVVLAAVAAAAATSPEADQVEALALAAETFGDAASTRTIVVLDSLVVTTGGFAMTEGRLYDDPTDRVTALADAGGIPDLEGVAVEVPRMGVVVAPQPELDAGARSALENQWRALFEASKASVSFDSASLVSSPQEAADLPAVTPVDIDRLEPVAAECRGLLPDRAVGFVGDSAEFLDPPTAKATIAGLAEAFAGCTGQILAEGSTSAARDQSFNIPLSERRARAVADELAAALGIPVEDIRIIGYGSEWPCRVADRDAAGHLLDTAASNRVVVVSRGAEPGQC